MKKSRTNREPIDAADSETSRVIAQSDAVEENLDIAATRRKYLEALAVSLGVDEATALIKATTLVHHAGDSNLGTLKDKKEFKFSLDPKDAGQIDSLGEWFLEGSQYKSLRFTVGSRILSLLYEDPKSGYFTNLYSWVSRWTDGDGDAKFREMIAAK